MITKEEFYNEYNNFQSLEDFENYCKKISTQDVEKENYILSQMFSPQEVAEIRQELDSKYWELVAVRYISEATSNSPFKPSCYSRRISSIIDYICSSSISCSDCTKSNGECVVTTKEKDVILKCINLFSKMNE